MRGWLYEVANEAVSRSMEEGMRRQLSDQLGSDADNWEEWKWNDADLKKEEELFNILDELDRKYQKDIGEIGDWSTKPVVPEIKKRGRKKKEIEPPTNNKRMTEFVTVKKRPSREDSLFWERVPTLNVTELEQEKERSVRLKMASQKSAERLSRGESCMSVSGAGGTTIVLECRTVSDVTRDDLPKHMRTDGQTITHWGVQEISKFNEDTRTISFSEKLQTSSAPACSQVFPKKTNNSRTYTKTQTNQTGSQPRQVVGVGGLVDVIRKNETLKSGGKAD